MTNQAEKLSKLSDNQLMDVVKNYRQYGYSEELRSRAIAILDQRGFSVEELKLSGNYDNRTYDFAAELFHSFQRNSNIAFFLYFSVITLRIVIYNYWLSESTVLFTILYSSVILLYFVFLLRSFLNQQNFYKAIGDDSSYGGILLYLFLGMPFYFLMYFYFNNQMKEKMNSIR